MPAAKAIAAGGRKTGRQRAVRRKAGRPAGTVVPEATILDAARSLFLQAGYDGVNLERIAAAAGLSRQTLYNRFGSKEALFRAMLARHWALLTDTPLVQSPRDIVGDRPPDAVLADLSRTILEFIDERRQVDFTRLVIAESRHLPWIAEEFYRLGKAPLMQALAACLDEMHRRRQIDCPDPGFAAHQFLGLLQEFVFWPKVMAIGAGTARLPGPERAVAESVRMFLCRYGHAAACPPADGN
ncbi:TetR/AcrR family transcriptional regulator [Marinibaculum pumilum]|uniref:TetR/AcrR family transcriptional regulator n=1 Tax=Marinibaculum pumilum TaxID=1766165 RepID=A0ABV7L5H3_9PROT